MLMFPHVLRVPENVQVADGPEPTRARGVRQNLVYLSVLSQRHANEVQSVESPEEGARLLRLNSTIVIAEEMTFLFRFAIVSIDVHILFFLNELNEALFEVRRFLAKHDVIVLQYNDVANDGEKIFPSKSDPPAGPAHLQEMRKHVRVLQLVDETHEGGVRKTTKISMPVLSKEIEVTLQPIEAHANEARF
ncbi:hypothetical protein P5V15_004094 [Pogonomyrmex californicus]